QRPLQLAFQSPDALFPAHMRRLVLQRAERGHIVRAEQIRPGRRDLPHLDVDRSHPDQEVEDRFGAATLPARRITVTQGREGVFGQTSGGEDACAGQMLEHPVTSSVGAQRTKEKAAKDIPALPTQPTARSPWRRTSCSTAEAMAAGTDADTMFPVRSKT